MRTVVEESPDHRADYVGGAVARVGLRLNAVRVERFLYGVGAAVRALNAGVLSAHRITGAAFRLKDGLVGHGFVAAVDLGPVLVGEPLHVDRVTEHAAASV